jgi:Recombination endonuclease VII
MTVEEYEKLFEEQEGRCAICGRDQETKLAVDHDHQTGERRGLLCKQCNVGLGYFRDDTAVLERAISYLNR